MCTCCKNNLLNNRIISPDPKGNDDQNMSIEKNRKTKRLKKIKDIEEENEQNDYVKIDLKANNLKKLRPAKIIKDALNEPKVMKLFNYNFKIIIK